MSKEQLKTLAEAFTRKELPGSEVELSGEVPYSEVEPYRSEALGHLASHLELPGFRVGHVPKDLALKKIGESAVLEEAAERFMQAFYPTLVTEHKVDVVGRPHVQITKLATGNPVGLTVRAAVYPEIVLPKDWRALGSRVAQEPVADTTIPEVDEALEALRKARAKAAAPGADPKAEVAPEELPALDDAFAKSLGNFTNLDDLKAKIKENLKAEKEQKARDKRRGEVVEVLLKKTKVEVPAIFVESELEKIIAQMKDDITRMSAQGGSAPGRGLTFEDYLKQVGKTEEQIRADFRDQAHKRAKLQLALNKIAEEEKVVADKEAVEKEMKHALEHFPDADLDALRIHIETILRNEKTLQLLEEDEKRA